MLYAFVNYSVVRSLVEYFLYLDSSSSYPILFSPSNNPGNIHCVKFTKFGQQTLNFHYWGVFFFPCEKRAKNFLDFSNIKWWAPYSWGTNLSVYPPYSQPYLSGFMLINLKMSLLHSVRFLLVRLLLRPM